MVRPFCQCFFSLRVNDPIGNVELLAEAPLVAGAEDGWDSGLEMVVDVGGCQVGKWFKKFGGLPCVQGSGEVLAGAEQHGVVVVRGQHGEVRCVGRDSSWSWRSKRAVKRGCCLRWVLWRRHWCARKGSKCCEGWW